MKGIRRHRPHRQGRTDPGRAAPVLVAIVGVALAVAAASAVLVGRRGDRRIPDASDVARWREAALYHRDVSGDVEKARVALESLTAARPEDVDALVALGETLAGAPRRFARAAELFERALEYDSLSAEAHAGLVEARARLGEMEDAGRALRRFARLRPDHPFPELLAARLAWVRGDAVGAAAALGRLEAGFPGDLTVRAWTAEERARIALVGGRLPEADAHFAEALAAARTRGDPAEILERTIDRAWATAWWTADTARAVARVEAAMGEFPPSSMPADAWPFHYLAEFFAMTGRPDRAGAILDAHAAHMEPPPDAVPNPWWQAAWGLIALAEGRPEDAVERFRLWDDGIGCTVCALGDLGRALDAAGRRDSARVVWRRYLASTDLQRIEWDPYYLTLARERAGRP